MSSDWYQDIVDFHREVMIDNFPTYPHLVDAKQYVLRAGLIIEEIGETLEALRTGNLAELADGIVDSIVVLLGTAVTYGIDVRPVWDIVHESNMTKRDGPMREDGKRLKPPMWQPPDVDLEIRRQMERERE